MLSVLAYAAVQSQIGAEEGTDEAIQEGVAAILERWRNVAAPDM